RLLRVLRIRIEPITHPTFCFSHGERDPLEVTARRHHAVEGGVHEAPPACRFATRSASCFRRFSSCLRRSGIAFSAASFEKKTFLCGVHSPSRSPISSKSTKNHPPPNSSAASHIDGSTSQPMPPPSLRKCPGM